jgi:CRP-like cAMP-binding protein
MAASPADLAPVPLFASLSEEELDELASWFEVKSVGEGVRLAGEGASGYSFFVLAEGRADVTADGAELATLGPGDFFGEIAILGDGRRSATVTTNSPTKVLVLFGTEFRRLHQAHPAIAERIEAAMRERADRRSGASG